MTVKEIRAKFPNPVSPSREGGYCVGGAFMLATMPDISRYSWGLYLVGEVFPSQGLPRLFPTKARLAASLMYANQNLRQWRADRYAYLINLASYNEDFERAWYLLGKALDFGKVGGE